MICRPSAVTTRVGTRGAPADRCRNRSTRAQQDESTTTVVNANHNFLMRSSTQADERPLRKSRAVPSWSRACSRPLSREESSAHISSTTCICSSEVFSASAVACTASTMPHAAAPEDAFRSLELRAANAAAGIIQPVPKPTLSGTARGEGQESTIAGILRGESQGISAHSARIPEFPLVLDLISEDGRRNVYAGEREVRPPTAPTTGGREFDRERRHQPSGGRPVADCPLPDAFRKASSKADQWQLRERAFAASVTRRRLRRPDRAPAGY